MTKRITVAALLVTAGFATPTLADQNVLVCNTLGATIDVAVGMATGDTDAQNANLAADLCSWQEIINLVGAPVALSFRPRGSDAAIEAYYFNGQYYLTPPLVGEE